VPQQQRANHRQASPNAQRDCALFDLINLNRNLALGEIDLTVY